MAGTNSEEDRLRSFTEQYLIERAGTFRVGHEQEDAFAAMEQAVSAYRLIAEKAARQFPRQMPVSQGSANSGYITGGTVDSSKWTGLAKSPSEAYKKAKDAGVDHQSAMNVALEVGKRLIGK